ncbi:MAG: hypothetical protein HKP20_06800, partial [Akkermansiaceae bacterium]|nr:hypothetical protein [Akkermansiaceae bacterium]
MMVPLVFSSSPVGKCAQAQPVAQDGEIKQQYQILAADLNNAARINQHQQETFHPAALIAASDRDPVDIILRRTRVLHDDLKKNDHHPGLDSRLKQLEELAAQTPVADSAKRYALFQQTYVLRRKIAFSNPLLDFDKILFIKRHRSTFNHMCDQYYGSTARPGGGLYVLTHPFSQNPTVENILAESHVAQGRLKGQKLEGGSFLSPELSYDGQKIYFSYVECTG